jgi:hypothetical protein
VSRRIEGLFCAKGAAGIRKKSGLKLTADEGHTATTEKKELTERTQRAQKTRKRRRRAGLKPGLYIDDGRGN